jgi:predicted GH43/DUF377 family glycosyl hydrolase
MTRRLRATLLLKPSDIVPSRVDWEVVGVFNPAVVVVGDELVILARVAEQPIERRNGLTPLPRWSGNGQLEVDWIADDDLHELDARVVAINGTGDLRLTSVSHLQVFRCPAPFGWGDAKSAEQSVLTGSTKNREWVLPDAVYEEFGIEDPRITKIDDTYWITYVAVSRHGACTALMSSLDMKTFHRHGIIFPCENKDVVLFPEKINGEYVALHRPNPSSHFSPPQIWIARSPDLIHWGKHEPLLCGCKPWEGDRVGAGTPPILIDEGWLLLYHGSETSSVAGQVGRYTVGALLLDAHEPSRVVARSAVPIMTPITDYEKEGFVPNVVFPTAMQRHNDTLQVFYGAADTCIAIAEFSKREIIESLITQNGKP